jgi:hypothetical protein
MIAISSQEQLTHNIRNNTHHILPPNSNRLFSTNLPNELKSSSSSSSSSPPQGTSLFQYPIHKPKDLLHRNSSITRTFSPQSNAQAMLIAGGEQLAAYASFDPDYTRVKAYIRNHAVGPAVLSPVLLQGLVGSLIEASLPQGVVMNVEMMMHRPLIVGVEVKATIEVISVSDDEDIKTEASKNRITNGYTVKLSTEVKRVSDGAILLDGLHTVWLPHI